MNRPFEPEFIINILPELAPYLGVTLLTVVLTVVIGGFLGFLIAFAKIKGNKGFQLLADLFVYVLRATPSVVLLFIVFYGLPELLLNTVGINTNDYNKLFFVVITFSLLFSATISEVMRSAYEAVDQGQTEAALAVGLTGTQAFIRIVLPQCIVTALPNFANALVILLKEGALAYTIGFIDIMGKGILIIGSHYGANALETYLALALVYWGVTILLEKSFIMLEGKLSRGRKNIAAV